MDSMVIKYVGLAWVVYGVHTYLAFAQVALFLFLVTSGILLLLKKRKLGKWATRLGFSANKRLGEKAINGWLMIATGIAMMLPLLGFSYWFAVAACPFSVYWIVSLGKDTSPLPPLKSGNLARNGLIVSVLLVFGFTLWEARDLVRAAWDINYRAVYWQNKEVHGWQKENNPNAPKVGEMAPDFELTDVTGSQTVRLSDFRGKKPVVLLFGSFT